MFLAWFRVVPATYFHIYAFALIYIILYVDPSRDFISVQDHPYEEAY